jgi:hypothetical protein
MRTTHLIACVTLLTLSAACGKTDNPMAPSSTPVAGAQSGAVITGSIASSGSVSGITVTVVGTNITRSVDSSNRFSLPGVPTGDVQLRFDGPGISATMPVPAVERTETISVTVTLTSTSATVENQTREGGSLSRVEGLVTAVPPTTAAGSFVVAGKTVTTDATTTFEVAEAPGSFADLAVGRRVEVTGSVSGSAIAASKVEIAPAAGTVVPDPTEASVTGVLTSRTGTGQVLTLIVGGKTVLTSALTVLTADGGSGKGDQGGGSQPADFTALVVGVTLEVEGTLRTDGSIDAKRIKSEGAEEIEFEQTGAISVFSGAAGCPSVTFTLNGVTVQTSAATDFRVGCALLTNGTVLAVKGVTLANGRVNATRISKNN